MTRTCASHRRRALLRAAVLATASAGVPTALRAQAPAATPGGNVLSNEQVSVPNLVRMLEPADVDVGGVKTRGVRVQRPGAAPPPRRDASLLVTFVTNSAMLTARARELLDVVGEALNTNQLRPFNFTVEGHADPRGNAQANRTLSQARADSVRAYLIDRHRIADERLVSVGKGDTELLNRDNPAAPENRRVTIVTRTE
jgi:outer membrane protein OmpA-like peptidoglycan-associated protein